MTGQICVVERRRDLDDVCTDHVQAGETAHEPEHLADIPRDTVQEALYRFARLWVIIWRMDI